jgi:hypothetical protein
MRIFLPFFILILFAASPAQSQFSYPASASTRLDFAQLTDGGTPDQRWTVTLAVANPDLAASATVTFTFYRNNGQLLPLDFGQGASSTLVTNVPAGGSRIFTSAGTSVDPVTGREVVGWARAVSNIPIYGTVFYRATQNGAPMWDVAAAGTGPTYYFGSQAKYILGVALANPSSTATIHLRLTPREENGTVGTTWDESLPPNGHTSFVLGDKGIVPRSFTGTVAITSTDTPPAPFVAWTLYERDGLLIPLPQGEMRAPAPYSRRPQDTLALMQAGSSTLVRALGTELYDTPPDSVIQNVMQISMVVEEGAALSASYKGSDSSVHLSQGMVETLGSSDAALAFLVGHMVARGVLERTGLPDTGIGASFEIQTAADGLSLAAMLTMGYDPGGMSDFFSRLRTALGQDLSLDPGLLSEFGPLDGIGERTDKTWTKIVQACASTPQLTQICQKAHDYWHPSYPAKIP